jgi:hypothetical protein
MQNSISIANWWRSPFDADRQLYLDENVFLPVIDNESFNSTQRFNNFCRPSKMFYFGSPADTTLSPWSTSLFGFFDNTLKLVDAKQLPIYQQDLFGLKTMMDAGRAQLIELEGLSHTAWLTNETNFVNNILPLLI